MNQILYTNEPSYNEKFTKATEFANQNLHYNPKKRAFFKPEGMIIISLILIITICTVILMGLGLWNTTSEAMSQEEIIIGKLSDFQITIEQSIKHTASEIEKNTLKDVKMVEPKLVVKKVKGNDGKTYEIVANLSIPSLGINYPVLASTSTELLKVSLNKYWGPNPNEVGNLCIVGHNYNDTRFFGKLNQIKNGAEIKITDMQDRTVSYYVYKTDMIDPFDTSCTSQLTNGAKEITLITCNVDGSQRFIAKARANES